MKGHWIQYAPREFQQGRDYAVLMERGVSLSPGITDLFISFSEEALRAAVGASSPVWQYVSLGARGPAVLMRCATEDRESAQAPVVWGLLLPLEYLESRAFALYTCIEAFPAQRRAKSHWPQVLDLSMLRAEADRDKRAAQLVAHYLQSRQVRVNIPDTQEALRLFCRVLEILPGGDRLAASFATATLRQRALTVDRTQPEVDAMGPAPDGRALLEIWDRLRTMVGEGPEKISLLQDPSGWPVELLRHPAPAQRFAQAVELALGLPEPSLQRSATTLLRQGLERRLMEIACDVQLGGGAQVAAVLDELSRSGLFEQGAAIPPAWPARMAVQWRALSGLSHETLSCVFKPGAVPVLLNGIREDSTNNALFDLLGGLAHAQLRSAQERLLWSRACDKEWAGVLADPQRLNNRRDFATTVAALALYFMRQPGWLEGGSH